MRTRGFSEPTRKDRHYKKGAIEGYKVRVNILERYAMRKVLIID